MTAQPASDHVRSTKPGRAPGASAVSSLIDALRIANTDSNRALREALAELRQMRIALSESHRRERQCADQLATLRERQLADQLATLRAVGDTSI